MILEEQAQRMIETFRAELLEPDAKWWNRFGDHEAIKAAFERPEVQATIKSIYIQHEEVGLNGNPNELAYLVMGVLIGAAMIPKPAQLPATAAAPPSQAAGNLN